MLRTGGPDVYDQWVAHEIPFNDPAVVAAVDAVGTIVKNDDYVLGGAESIPSTSFQEAGLPLLDGGCFMHRQASFYGNQFPEGTTKGPDGQVNAFYLPAVAADVHGEGGVRRLLWRAGADAGAVPGPRAARPRGPARGDEDDSSVMTTSIA